MKHCKLLTSVAASLIIMLISTRVAFAEKLFRFQDLNAELKELDMVVDRRLQRVTDTYDDPKLAWKWSKELRKDGTWSDVDYTRGCGANRADWQAPNHLKRTLTIASLWSTTADVSLLTSATSALKHWFANDYPSEDCIGGQGRPNSKCPCSTPGYWNPNWWYQMILLPDLVGSVCLILSPTLGSRSSDLDSCILQTSRSWRRIDGEPGRLGRMTGANLLDVASAGGVLALLTKNHTLFYESLNKSWGECDYRSFPRGAEGIKLDGSFMQHGAQLHSGTYGSIFMQRMISLFIETKGTRYYPPPGNVQDPFLTLFSAAEWLMFRRGEKGGLVWTYSVIGRWVSHKHEDYDDQMTLDLGKVVEATEGWDKEDVFVGAVGRLSDRDNRWRLRGNRYFYTTDFLVHRGSGYMLTLKMYSTRTISGECLNSQNPYGYHLSDGSIYTHISGLEYDDIFGAWDWDLIPGTTSLHKEVHLTCKTVRNIGKHHRVGAVALDTVGSVAVMTHTDPRQGSHNFTKTYFFFPGVYAVQFPELWWNPNSQNPMRTTLDQRHARGQVILDGRVLEKGDTIREQEAETVWHDRVGYVFSKRVNLGVGVVQRVADWKKVGISVGNETQTHFLAYVNHKREESGLSYVARLKVDNEEFQKSPQGGVTILQSSENVTAAVFRKKNSPLLTLGFVFLSPSNYTTGVKEVPWVFLDAPAVLIINRDENTTLGWRLGIADPTQLLKTVNFATFVQGATVKKSVQFPTGAYSGDTVIITL